MRSTARSASPVAPRCAPPAAATSAKAAAPPAAAADSSIECHGRSAGAHAFPQANTPCSARRMSVCHLRLAAKWFAIDMPEQVTFGAIAGVSVGAAFASRRALIAEAGVHRTAMQGISGLQSEEQTPSCSPAGMPMTGTTVTKSSTPAKAAAGWNTGRQVADQEMVKGNLGLLRSQQLGQPVRVIRGAGHPSIFSPDQGYRYDSLFRVDEVWHEPSIDGPTIKRSV